MQFSKMMAEVNNRPIWSPCLLSMAKPVWIFSSFAQPNQNNDLLFPAEFGLPSIDGTQFEKI
jgi:hypothetical protein